MDILPDSRVSVWDYRDGLIRTAIVLRRYGYRFMHNWNVCYDDYGNKFGETENWAYPDVVDVRFEHDGRESNGHFTDGIRLLTARTSSAGSEG